MDWETIGMVSKGLLIWFVVGFVAAMVFVRLSRK